LPKAKPPEKILIRHAAMKIGRKNLNVFDFKNASSAMIDFFLMNENVNLQQTNNPHLANPA
jgi:hypothetical protein